MTKKKCSFVKTTTPLLIYTMDSQLNLALLASDVTIVELVVNN